MKTIVFCNARDELHINEWIAHHILLGFDKIYIFDHLSTTPIMETAKIFLDSNLYKDRVTIERYDTNKSWSFFKDYRFQDLQAFVAHFQFQSYETYLFRKVNRNRDDVPRLRYPYIPEENFHKIYNDVENKTMLDKYHEGVQSTLASLHNPFIIID